METSPFRHIFCGNFESNMKTVYELGRGPTAAIWRCKFAPAWNATRSREIFTSAGGTAREVLGGQAREPGGKLVRHKRHSVKNKGCDVQNTSLGNQPTFKSRHWATDVQKSLLGNQRSNAATTGLRRPRPHQLTGTPCARLCPWPHRLQCTSPWRQLKATHAGLRHHDVTFLHRLLFLPLKSLIFPTKSDSTISAHRTIFESAPLYCRQLSNIRDTSPTTSDSLT